MTKRYIRINLLRSICALGAAKRVGFFLLLSLCALQTAFAQGPGLTLVDISTNEVQLGNAFTLAVVARNFGADSDYGSISISFPQLDAAGDAANVWGNTSDDAPGYQDFEMGEPIFHRDGDPRDADYLLVEFGDNNWEFEETNFVSLSVKPRKPGTFEMYVRANMRVDANTYKNEPSSSATEDQQGWPVRRITVTVNGEGDTNQPSSVAIVVLDSKDLSDFDAGFLDVAGELFTYEIVGVNDIKAGTHSLSDYDVVVSNIFGNAGDLAVFDDAAVMSDIRTAQAAGTHFITASGSAKILEVLGLAQVRTIGTWCPALPDSYFIYEHEVEHPILNGVSEFSDYTDYTLQELTTQDFPALVWRVSNQDCYPSRLGKGEDLVTPDLHLVSAFGTGFQVGQPAVVMPIWSVGNAEVLHLWATRFTKDSDGYVAGKWGEAGKKLLQNAVNYYSDLCEEGGETCGDTDDNKLIAYYSFDGNANDVSGNGHDGTVNGATLTADRFGNANSAYDFDGIDDYIDVPVDPQFNVGLDDYTVSAWVQYARDAAGRQVFVSSGGSGDFQWVQMSGDQIGDIRFGLKSGTNASQTTTSYSSITDDQWHFLVGTRQEDTVRLYIDGQLVQEVNNPELGNVQNYSSGGFVRIGNNPSYGGRFNDGVIDDVRIYNRALSDAEIQDLCEEGGWTCGDTDGNELVAYYPFDGNANDASGNGHDGTVNGATLTADRFGNANSAYDFDGDDDVIVVDDQDDLDLTADLTVAYWVKPDYSGYDGTRFSVVVSKHDSGTSIDGTWHSVIRTRDRRASFQAAPVLDATAPTSASAIPEGEWSFIAFTYDDGANVLNTYVDGVLSSSDNVSFEILNTALDLEIGRDLAGEPRYGHKGSIDDVRIYNHALSESEVHRLFNTGPSDEVASSVSGYVYDQDGDPISGAVVQVTMGTKRQARTQKDGAYHLYGLPPGRGYEILAAAEGYKPQALASLVLVPGETTTGIDFHLSPSVQGPYAIKPLAFDPNPTVSQVGVGGTAHRYYEVINAETGTPAAGVQVYVQQLPDGDFVSEANGIVQIDIPASAVGLASQEFVVNKVGETVLDQEDQVTFGVDVVPRRYEKAWQSSVYTTFGISWVDASIESGAKVSAAVTDYGDGEPVAEDLNVHRQGRAGVGVSWGVGTPLQTSIGPVGVGAEAKVGLNVTGLTEDIYRFPIKDYSSSEAMAQYILFGDGNFNALDAILVRLLTICTQTFTDDDVLTNVYVGDRAGLAVTGYAEANAQFGSGFRNGNMGVGLGANIAGSLTGTRQFTYLREGNTLLDELEVTAEVEANAGAGLKFGSPYKPDFEDDLHLGFGLGVNGMLGASLENEYSSEGLEAINFSLLRGYGLAGGLLGGSLRGSLGGQREIITTYTFREDHVRMLVESASDLARSLARGEGTIRIDASSFDRFLFNTIESVSKTQQETPDPALAIPYAEQRTDKLPIVDFGVNVAVNATGEKTVSAHVGGGIRFARSYTYLTEQGKLYDWQHYPTFTYGTPPEIGLTYDEIVQNIIHDLPLTVRAALAVSRIIDLALPGKRASMEFVLNDNGSKIVLEDSSLPAGLSTLACYNWSWWDNAANKLAPANKNGRSYQIANNIRLRAQQQANLSYGIGGFYQFEPYNIALNDRASELTIVYDESELDGADEAELGIYREDKQNGGWIYVGGEVNAAENYVRAHVDTLGTFTLAPRAPAGRIELQPSVSSIPADSLSTLTVTSGTIRNNDTTVVSDGTLFTVVAEQGTITTADADSGTDGIQVASEGGQITFTVLSATLPLRSRLAVRSVTGTARGETTVAFTDDVPPTAPQIEFSSISEGRVVLRWIHERPEDLGGYKVYFDGDASGTPYEGTATILGSDSPVDVGLVDTAFVAGLDVDSTYYIAVTAYDIAGNESAFSNELSVTVTGTAQEQVIDLPDDFYIEANYPNPFNPVTTIEFGIPNPGPVRVAVYNVLGQRISVLMDQRLQAGRHKVRWDATNQGGVRVATGVYFYVIQFGNHIQTGKMVLIK